MPEQSSYEIGLAIDEKEKALQACITSLATIEQEILTISREIIERQLKKKTLEMARGKASANRQVTASELRVLRNEFYRVRNENR